MSEPKEQMRRGKRGANRISNAHDARLTNASRTICLPFRMDLPCPFRHTTAMLVDILLTLAGFGLLIWGADRFVAGASSLASILGVPPILIGLTIVGIATSAPEIMVSASAAAQGLTAMAVGNAIGSNIANIGLVLGAMTLFAPVDSTLSKTLKTEITMLVVLTPATLLLFLDNYLGRGDGILLLLGVAVFLAWITRTGIRTSTADPLAREVQAELPDRLSLTASLVWILVGFGVLLLGANLLVNGAENLARSFGVSELIIGLTVVAIGTSLPELAISLISAMKGEHGIAIGNIIGSNVFNLLAVIGVAGVIQPAAMEESVLILHYPVMIALTLVLLRIAYNPFGQPGFGRFMGMVLVGAFLAYQALLLSGNV